VIGLVQDQRTGMSYYTVRVLLNPEELAGLGNAKLSPGRHLY
jgi:HlyD family secretion protein